MGRLTLRHMRSLLIKLKYKIALALNFFIFLFNEVYQLMLFKPLTFFFIIMNLTGIKVQC